MSKNYPFWPFWSGIGFALFGILLVAVRVNPRVSLVFFGVGLFLFVFWVYLILKTDRKKKAKTLSLQKCLCPICKHEATDLCVKQKCPCCVEMKDNTVMGHSN
ncbi:MAG: hypothetical protein AB7V56_05845 [Candidatus Nitrosocosmicus sp.]|uniref:hypothetical protein n=1 Tax=Candidatus Nitrosocosmicus agrestis TaxID=2563600 RepID=UPI00122DDCE5|nr:hypothetical protein [Candidatus Nitrosocosmicus sp. SS]KAA2283418.1 hypothetical protein F1Z66_02675 [Candidatus Nitrosocosmicus sp. SS]KAF0868935.1 hypothetical protein E5N71_08050 [Candidatus Nitrosocosmicus sp. SS]MDR4492085.1 hypothetical protein [Candidatus Nitrosocosmicus sp.]HET6588540.1 hypothetical protein [Candidatus Nitrosocosmicus sp.]